ncbi:hypothetical protein ROHU_002657 [Labeo rohita]|uniref:Integrase catalytic domain-containing protein n=1 Tax=Labeo rohita TaxID=84645 RepID=A0A498NX48_LABRO|nr:hypothetical protein ROHU_002657 [Labeo rohita]
MAQRSNSKKGDEDIQSETARSRSSRSSGTTSSSKIGMAVAIAKAKAEAAQARAAHTQKEIELKVQQAHVQANLELHQPHSQPNDVIFPTPHPLNHSGSSSQKNIKPDPSSPACTHGASHDHSTFTGDLIKYLARSSLVTSGLTAYDDQPMNCWAWKTSFLNAIADLDLSAAGELDLLAKYLGKESAEQVRRIKTVNIKDPATGLRMAWERLDEIYGSPEAIEQALFNKLENFPKVTMKDPRRLRELADLLSELQAAKEDKYLAGLSYLDTSRGIRPIIEKLPYNLQEKWLYLGTRYKHEHFVSFPPFSVLVDFIATKQGPVYVHKTQISGTTKAECRGSTERIDPNKHCPLHRKPHPLRKCRGFHEKSINDRKQLLKEHYICFRCCSSTDHLAKNCTAEIKCTECGSTTHMTALHPYPPTWKSKSFPSTSEEGGEEDKVDIQEVKSTCTQVCGEGLSARTCAKICLVSVFPNGCKKESKRMYAILDEQSNRSLARSEFFEIFKISGNSYSYTLKTCAGHTETAGRRASGYTVASVDNKISIHLPTLLECNQIPNVRTEIPTPEAAFHHVHLKRIADKIPPLDPDAKILLLLGRDILQVHKVREQISGPGDAPFAQRLDLGWVVVGDVCLGGRAQKMLAASNLRLHKIASNRTAVIEAFPFEDRAKDVSSMDLFVDDLPIQRSLGLLWNMRTDTFTFQIEDDQRPFTRRGVLSTVNSLYDPLGFLAPITVHGRLILRELTKQAEDWDTEWTRWKRSLRDLEGLQIPRPYTSFSTAGALRRELYVFADASVKAIAAVAYIKVTSHQDQTEIGFVFGKAKLAPQPDLTIPRLELCAAVLAIEIAEMVVAEMDTTFDSITYYTDSKVVLGYIQNQSRRFYVFVHNRIQRIRQSPCSGLWKYVPTHLNPADIGSRSVTSDLLSSTTWLKGPAFLHDVSLHSPELQEVYDLIDPDTDSELRPQVVASFTHVTRDVIHPQRFERFSKFSTLLTAVAHLIHVARSFARSTRDECRGWHVCRPTEEELSKAKICIMKSVQNECYSEDLKCINSGSNIPPNSSLWKLHPILDQNQLLRVGGRIERSDLSMNEVHPIIIPGRHHLATLLVSHYHEAVKHQGRHLTEVHIEVIEAMSTSSFINALRRFFAIRGPAKQIYSDCGTNFIGASREMEMDQSNLGFKKVEEYLATQSCTWVFNPPHASHMGGAWERMIGIAHRILDCMLLEQKRSHLSHEVLATLMAEVTAIMNARPLVPVSLDPESLLILTLAMLLTLKTGSVPPPPPGSFEEAHLVREEWKQVQGLAEMFWNEWKHEVVLLLSPKTDSVN